MEQTLLQQIETMQRDLVQLVEQGHSLLDGAVLEKSQALDLLMIAYVEQQSDWTGAEYSG